MSEEQLRSYDELCTLCGEQKQLLDQTIAMVLNVRQDQHDTYYETAESFLTPRGLWEEFQEALRQSEVVQKANNAVYRAEKDFIRVQLIYGANERKRQSLERLLQKQQLR
jgi:hypothetical protein